MPANFIVKMGDFYQMNLWFKHIVSMTEHHKGLGRSQKAMFSPLQNTHMHI